MKNIFLNTQQTKIVVPSGELLKIKNTDFRILVCLSAMSNSEYKNIEGKRERYILLKNIDKYTRAIAMILDLKESYVVSKINNLLALETKEFYLDTIKPYEVEEDAILIDYTIGGFINLDVEVAERLILNGDNTTLKAYIFLSYMLKNKVGVESAKCGFYTLSKIKPVIPMVVSI